MISSKSKSLSLLAELFLFILYFLFHTQTLLAGSVRASITPKEGTIGNDFQVSLQVSGELDQNVEFPSIEGVSVQSTGNSRQISIYNGRRVSSLTLTYSLSVTAPGSYTIPPIKVHIDGRSETTQPLSFEVRKPSDHLSIEGSTLPAAFIQTTFSKKNPFIGESLVKTTKVFFRIKVSEESRIVGDHEDLKIKEFNKEMTQETFGGKNYSVIVYQDLIIPKKSGSHTTAGDIVNLVVLHRSSSRNRDFFGGIFDDAFAQRSVQTLAAKDSSLEVQQLPKQGRPASFKGAIGTFKIAAKLNTSKLKQGDTSTLTVTVTGKGLLENIPNLPLDFGSDIKVYPDKPSSKEEFTSKGVFSQKTIKYALVPNKAGKLPLGHVSLEVFDPSDQKYKELKAQLGTLEVEAVEEVSKVSGGQGLSPQLTKNSVDSLASDLIDIHRTYNPKDVSILSQKNVKLYFIIIGLLPMILLLTLMLQGFNRSKSHGSSRHTKAYKIFDKESKNWKKTWGHQDLNIEAIKSYHEIYKHYLGNKFKTNSQSLTVKEISRFLKQSGLNDESIQQAIKLSNDMDELEYSRNKASSSNYLHICEIANNLVKEIDKHVK